MKYILLVVLLFISCSANCATATPGSTSAADTAKHPQAGGVPVLNAYQPPANPAPVASNQPPPQPSTPLQFLIMLVLGAILGATGQGIRVVVGLKKASDSNDKFDQKQLVTSLLIALVVGGIAGVLAATKTTNFSLFSVSDAMLFIGAGYAGTDFIEGFMTTNSSAISTPIKNPTPNFDNAKITPPSDIRPKSTLK